MNDVVYTNHVVQLEKGANPMRRENVTITIESKQNGEHVVQQVTGSVFIKGDTTYIRYLEPEEHGMGETSTTVKFSFDELRVIRHGEVEAEQVFRMNEKIPGFYRVGTMRLAMETHLTAYHHQLEQGLGELSWQYNLILDEHSEHPVEVRIQIQEDYK
jgi:uncharacterized beta-barrel protein YwiB (DUF1934 family)